MSDRLASKQDGFSMVELLVTIVLAGIAFAAMVPMFISAQQAVSSDLMRNAALQLAQDKLEKIRALDYDLITTANLQSSTFANGQFGTAVSWTTGGGGSRTFNVAYGVSLVPSGAQAGKESYKQVTVTVSWNAPPAPVRAAVLSTFVSKQYSGPQIIRFDVGPNNILEEDETGWSIVAGPVVIDAYIAPEDIASMNQSATEADRGYVLFTVTSLNGLKVVQANVTSPLNGEPAHYQFVWDNSSAPDGIYIFQAVAVAGFGSRTQGSPVSVAMRYTNHAPPAPTGLIASGGNAVAYLNWDTSPAGDLDHYEVWRSTDGVNFALLVTTTSPSYTDSGLTNDVTYTYKVRVVDTENLTSPFSAAVQVTPQVPKDTAPPTVPGSLVAAALSGQPTIELTWAASTDSGNPASGVAGYSIERSADKVTWAQLAGGYQATVYDDTGAGFNRTWWYRVCAVDNAGNGSAWAGPVSATTEPVPERTLTVYNNSSSFVYVWVQQVSSGLWYSTNGTPSSTRPNSVRILKNKNQAWSPLPPGAYNVFISLSSNWDTNNPPVPKMVDVTSGNGTVNYP